MHVLIHIIYADGGSITACLIVPRTAMPHYLFGYPESLEETVCLCLILFSVSAVVAKVPHS